MGNVSEMKACYPHINKVMFYLSIQCDYGSLRLITSCLVTRPRPSACVWAWRMSVGSHCLRQEKLRYPNLSRPSDLHLVARGRRIQLLDETKRSRSVFLVSGYGGNWSNLTSGRYVDGTEVDLFWRQETRASVCQRPLRSLYITMAGWMAAQHLERAAGMNTFFAVLLALDRE